jgi:mannose-6-phosphate isomerase
MNPKAWGHEMIYANHELYSGSIIIIKEGERTPYIYHKRRDKTFFVLQGTVNIIIEGKTTILNERDEAHIPPKIMHRLHAIKGDATIIEVGTKIEDDVVVVESDYERVGKV